MTADDASATSIARGATDVPLIEQTIGAYIGARVELHPDAIAIVSRHQHVRLTWQAMWDLSGQLAQAMLASGIQPKDRISIWAGNRYEWIIVQYAAARIGAVLVCINPTYLDDELRYVLQNSGSRLLFLAPGFRGSSLTEIAQRVAPACPDLIDTVDLENDWERFLARSSGAGVGLEDVEASLDRNDPINIQYTSGTTGRPKGAVLSHRNILNNGFLVCHGLRYGPADSVCVPVPLFHCFGAVLGVLGPHAHGASVVLPSESFDASAAIDAVVAEQCTSLYGVPTMFIEMLERMWSAGLRFTSIRTGLMGGAPCVPELRRRVRTEMNMPELSIVCGMTETSPISTQAFGGDPDPVRDDSIGRPGPHIDVAVMDPSTGLPVGLGEVGEQWTRGYSVMLGYWANERATADTIDADGWLHTGDLARLDEQGYVTNAGRMKDVILRGGENIYPTEIEDLLMLHPQIREAYVVGVPDERLGERVVAWVRLGKGSTASAQQLRAFCTERISRSKVPERWQFVTAFPKTGSGKIQKFKLRQMALEQLGESAAENRVPPAVGGPRR